MSGPYREGPADDFLSPALYSAFALSAAEPLAVTPRARLWKVTRSDGHPAVLKLLGPEGLADETVGIDLLRHWNGNGAVRVLGQAGPAVLMDWLDGPSLGDLCRSGEDARASGILAEVAVQLQAAGEGGPLPANLTPLDHRFEALFGLAASPDCPPGAWRDLQRAGDLARGLIASQSGLRPLHGDLHQDNVLRGAGQWCAIDPKGVLGEPAYEFANAFRNPVGIEALMRRPDRMHALAGRLAVRTGHSAARLLDWAAAHCALSIAWTAGAVVKTSDEFDLLSLLLAAAGRPG